MGDRANTRAAFAPRLFRVRDGIAEAAAEIDRWSPVRVVAGLVFVQWLCVAALARDVARNGWTYYQGGDQLWYYSLGWLLAHGHLYQTPVGYLWSWWLTPVARVAGPNVASAYPAILLLNVLVLLPVAMVALYSIAARLAGRLFGYWTLALWIAVPFIGVLYTNTGYHQRYTDVVLPQGLGLTAMADFPALVAVLVCFAFCARVAFSTGRPSLLDAAAGGAAAGAAVAIKPSVALILLGPILAMALRRAAMPLATFAAGAAPAVLVLAFWKDRGLGSLPLLSAPAGVPRGVATAAPVLGLNLHKYFGQLSWHMFLSNLDLLREHFWSGRLIEWLVVAGLIALARMSWVAFAFVAGSFLPFVLVKSSYIASIEDTSLFRILIPAFPLFVLLLAALPYLRPGARVRTQPGPVVHRWSANARLVLLGAAILLTAVAPAVAVAASARSGPPNVAELTGTQMPVPVDVPLGLRARVGPDGRVLLTWKAQHPAGGAVFYRVWRHAATPGRGLTCLPTPGAVSCTLDATPLATTPSTRQLDRPGRGRWVYRVGVAANWLDDPTQGDVYETSEPLVVHVP